MGTQDQGSHPRDPDREAVHEAGNPDDVLPTRSTSATARTAWRRRRASTSASRPRHSRSRKRRSSPASSRATCGRARTSTSRRRRGGATTRCSAWPRRASSRTDAAEAAKATPDQDGRSARRSTYSPAPYFVEEVRQQLEARYGAKQLYENGLSVQTSLDLPLQLAATRALQAGLRRLDKRRGFRAADAICSRPAPISTRIGIPAGRAPWPWATSCRPS